MKKLEAMNTNLKNRLQSLTKAPANKKDRLEVEKNILAARFLSEIQLLLDKEKLNRKDFAKRMGVSQSFISQLFTAEKTVSIDFLAKAQEELHFTFSIQAHKTHEESSIDTAIDSIKEIEKNIFDPKSDVDGFWVYYNKQDLNYAQSYDKIADVTILSIA